MNYRQAQDDYHASISSSNYSVGDVLDFYVRVEVSDTDREYTCFPTQAQLDWSTPNGDNIPEERDFFPVLVTNSAKVEALADDLQIDPSWVVGTDEWKWGAPNLEDFGQQPGNDYPFDNDVYQASLAPYCYSTSNTRSVSGPPWQLTTEEFTLDASMDQAVISYALWFYVRGAQGNEKFTVEIMDKNSVWVTPAIETIDPGTGNSLQRWIRHRITVSSASVAFGSKMRLRFTADRSEGTGTMEAVVDEVRVWGAYDNQ